jgi:predicted esterase
MLKGKLEQHLFPAQIECSYLIHVPETIDDTTLLATALHGYGSNAQDMLRLTVPTVGQHHIVAALQAPNQHYSTTGPDAREAYNWGIRQQWSPAIDLHHRMVKQVLTLLRERFSLGPEKTVLLGFSQPVGLNYRFAGTNPGWVRGVIGICGGVPRDWEEVDYQVDAAILHIARDEDEFYPLTTVEKFPERLRTHASDVEFHLLPGGHRFPSKAGSVIQPWLQRVFSPGR